MHESCHSWVVDQIRKIDYNDVIEIGSQDVNGSLKLALHGHATDPFSYTGVDVVEGPNVDYVYDGVTLPLEPVDLVVCTNVLEHVEDAVGLLKVCRSVMYEGSTLLIQAAGPGFQVHSGRSESLVLEPGEFYRNVHPDELGAWFQEAGFGQWVTTKREQWPIDTYGVAWR